MLGAVVDKMLRKQLSVSTASGEKMKHELGLAGQQDLFQLAFPRNCACHRLGLLHVDLGPGTRGTTPSSTYLRT